MQTEKIIKILKDNNIKVTDNRIKILDCLFDNEHFHAVSDIMKHSEGLNVKSIYNNIKILINKGIVNSYSFGGIVKYAINDAFIGEKNSVHLVDKDGEVIHVDVNEKIMDLIKKDIKKAGYEAGPITIFVNAK